ncbi:hypothetical protein AAFP35_17795 [Gordonia sp. CPCC 206044]|uniref:hypothetical protein n=1 Tax=Gordonia sp. CPCC 206044 TaxID=3140793 RepID=UPI003AF3E0D9
MRAVLIAEQSDLHEIALQTDGSQSSLADVIGAPVCAIPLHRLSPYLAVWVATEPFVHMRNPGRNARASDLVARFHGQMSALFGAAVVTNRTDKGNLAALSEVETRAITHLARESGSGAHPTGPGDDPAANQRQPPSDTRNDVVHQHKCDTDHMLDTELMDHPRVRQLYERVRNLGVHALETIEFSLACDEIARANRLPVTRGGELAAILRRLAAVDLGVVDDLDGV